MVKEGIDSTVRPKVQTYELDGGRLLLDSWAADGKPALSRKFVGLVRVGGVFALTGCSAVLLLSDWSGVTKGQEHVFSELQRSLHTWWRAYTEMDVADVAKARSVGGAASATPSWSFLASEQARENFESFAAAQAATAAAKSDRS